MTGLGGRLPDTNPGRVSRTLRRATTADTVRAASTGDVMAFSELRVRYGAVGVEVAGHLGVEPAVVWGLLIDAVYAVADDESFLEAYLRSIVDSSPYDAGADASIIVDALAKVGVEWLAGGVLGVDGHVAADLISRARPR